ncbi:hypothetical protein DFJ58DRAFT_874460 [Suillus subalutaceus]|uniref:uncharacterized protein n=1 Tax=Suillus subalutaceus TaxID=48586 RepID=UPI001B8758E5|nr:uncharacterized protein DFJ58DRAFT_874460 [Suillus subalutaceus]KAG1860274.1 hypothetical protein DFJ58DRAFT_874460 [Suillus subalutaceus]
MPPRTEGLPSLRRRVKSELKGTAYDRGMPALTQETTKLTGASGNIRPSTGVDHKLRQELAATHELPFLQIPSASRSKMLLQHKAEGHRMGHPESMLAIANGLRSPSWHSGNALDCDSGADACILIPRVVHLLQSLYRASRIAHHGLPRWAGIGGMLIALPVVAIGFGLDVGWAWRIPHLGIHDYN